MQLNDINDDMANAQKPYRVVAVIPVHERLELLPLTIGRLYRKNGVDRVICVGDGEKEKIVCRKSGAIWVDHVNEPLGAKWNSGFKAAKDLNPDAVLYVGSSDWLSDNWIQVMRPYVEQHHITGVPGCHFTDIPSKGDIRSVYWPGYIGPRSTESIGIGRLLSKKILDLIDWQPFDPAKNRSMDSQMKSKCAKFGYRDYFVREEAKAMSISTDKWGNMHQFDDHWSGRLPSQKIENIDELLKHFPEAYELQKAL